MARKRDYVLKDEDVSSPNSKKETSDEKSPVQNFARRDLTKEFEGNSSGGDSIIEIVSEDDDARGHGGDYYDKAERLPVFKRASIGLTSLEIVQIIVGGDFDQRVKCKVKPVAVHHNVSFIIDLRHVELKDLGADDNGAWDISCPKQRFHCFREDGCISSICHTKDNGEGVITLRRQYGHHKATKKKKNVTFIRVISSAVDHNSVTFPFAVVQVCFHIDLFCIYLDF